MNTTLTNLNLSFLLSKVHAKQVSIMTQWRRVKTTEAFLLGYCFEEYLIFYSYSFFAVVYLNLIVGPTYRAITFYTGGNTSSVLLRKLISGENCLFGKKLISILFFSVQMILSLTNLLYLCYLEAVPFFYFNCTPNWQKNWFLLSLLYLTTNRYHSQLAHSSDLLAFEKVLFKNSRSYHQHLFITSTNFFCSLHLQKHSFLVNFSKN